MDALEGLSRPETYVIGFTENRYSSMDDDKSPSPTDHLFGYSSPALDYAERTNKGAEHIFLDKSLSLDKKKHKSVGKINHDILDLVFELTERRKTPLLGRSFRDEFQRCDSDLSERSSVSIGSYSSGPTVEVQQLPPITQQPVLAAKNANKSNQRKKTGKKKGGKTEKNKQDSDNLPKLLNVVNLAVEQNKTKKIDETEQDKERDSKQQIDAEETTGVINKDPSDSVKTGMDKWKAITEKLVEINKRVKDGSLDISTYKGRYHTPEFSKCTRRMSYCQSSYDERAEKERMNNIRRRHMSQLRTGPLDFNKLKRQITTGRSKTFAR